jgi:pimeloyl-ACP methyl ester carboxylesterase
MRGNPLARDLWENAVSGLADPVDPGFVREFQESTIAEPVPPGFLDEVVGESLKVPARVWRSALASLLEADHSGELSKIDAPTLVVWGDRDVLAFRDEQEALAAAIPSARLVVYAGTGHALHWEQPERFAADLAAFVRAAID